MREEREEGVPVEAVVLPPIDDGGETLLLVFFQKLSALPPLLNVIVIITQHRQGGGKAEVGKGYVFPSDDAFSLSLPLLLLLLFSAELFFACGTKLP